MVGDDARARRRRCCASSTTCSTSPRSRPARIELEEAPFSLRRPDRRRRRRRFRRRPSARACRWSPPIAPGSTDALLGDRHAGAPDPVQPARQCAEVHRARRRRRRAPAREPLGDGTARASCCRCRDTGIGMSDDAAGAAVPAVLAGRQLDHAALRRHRPRPVDRAPAGRADGRRRRRSKARPGQGSTFTVTLDLMAAPADRRWSTCRSAEPPATSRRPRPALDGNSVLVVDDHPINREVLVRPAPDAGRRRRHGGRRHRGPAGLARAAATPSSLPTSTCRRWTASS